MRVCGGEIRGRELVCCGGVEVGYECGGSLRRERGDEFGVPDVIGRGCVGLRGCEEEDVWS